MKVMNNELQYKLCAKCKSMISRDNKGWYCPKCRGSNRKEYKSIYSKENEVYYSNRWKKTRDKIRKEKVFCEVCQELGIKGVLATEVHHIIKVIHGDDSTHYDPTNLVSVCNRHHKMIEGMSKTQLANALIEGSLI